MNRSRSSDPAARPWLISCSDPEHAAAEAARILLDAFVRAGERDFALALSGGRIAATLFDALATEAERRRSPLAHADYFWADERCVPPDHPESNYRVARQHLLQPLGVPAARVHRLRGEIPPSVAVQEAIVDWHAWCRAVRRPDGAFDAVVLGVGEDAHVASLFPGNLGWDLADPAPFRSVIGPKPPPQRVTVGYRMLEQARLVIVLAPGASKRPVLDACLAGDGDLPLARVLASRGPRTTVILGSA